MGYGIQSYMIILYELSVIKHVYVDRFDEKDQTYTVFNLITAPALITAPPPLTFYFIFTYYRLLDDLLALVVENIFT